MLYFREEGNEILLFFPFKKLIVNLLSLSKELLLATTYFLCQKL